MKHHVLNIVGKELKCRLDAQNVTALEKKLGNKNIMEVLMGTQVPSLDTILSTLHASLQKLEHGYTMQKVYELYDEFVDKDGQYMELIPELIKVLEVSGFFKSSPPVEKA